MCFSWVSHKMHFQIQTVTPSSHSYAGLTSYILAKKVLTHLGSFVACWVSFFSRIHSVS